MNAKPWTLLALLLGGALALSACPQPRGGGRDDDDAADDDDSGADDDDVADDDDSTGDDDDATGDDDDATGDDDDATGDDDDATGDDDDATGDDDDSTTAAPVSPSPGDLAIVEIMSDPEGLDSANEWFEVANVSGGPLELGGVQISFGDAGLGHTINGSVVLAAGARYVFGNTINTASNGGAPVDYGYGSIQMEEEADTLLLVNPSAFTVDEVTWSDGGGVGSWPVVDGWSMVLDMQSVGANATTANDLASNWCQEATYTQYAPGNADVNFGTPGTASTVSCALPASGNSPGDVVINEFMQNPANGVDDYNGEWFELYNTTNTAIDLFGWFIHDAEWDDVRIVTTLILPANGYVVLGRFTDTAVNGGAPVDYAYREELFLANTADELILLDPAGTEIDTIAYDEALAWPDAVGASSALDPPAIAGQNNDPTVWCVHAATDANGASADYDGNGNIGTPGAANNCAN